MHVASLPSRYGIGDLGPAAATWVDLLQEAGQSWWQSLPLGPTGYGNSPWRCLKWSGGRSSDAAPALIELAWSSTAALAIVPLQDVLNLGAEARMNVPGRAEGNWRWRCSADMLSITEIEWLRNLTGISSRQGVTPKHQTAVQ